MTTIMGVDIHPGSSVSADRQPRYSVVILRDGQVIGKFEDIPLYRVLRLILEYHVDIVAVDNVFELAETTSKLSRLFSMIPSGCRIVQVTGFPPVRSVNQIAEELGLKGDGSLWGAYVNAVAAYSGIGDEVRLFMDKTAIIVTKGRTPEQGGTSRDRYLRSIRASILRATKEIKKVLDENGLEYDLLIKRSKGGLEKSMFIVYAPREQLDGLVKSFHSKNVRVILKPYRSKLLVKDEKYGKKPVIVGVDPGTTVGLAVLDLEGTPLLVTSLKTPDRDEVLSKIMEIGEAVLVATDVARPPSFAKKIASLLNAKLYVPERDLSIEEKVKIVKEAESRYQLDIPDSHARDALAAALKAYHDFKPTLEEISSKLQGISGIDRYRVYAKVLKGMPISQAIESEFDKLQTRRERPPIKEGYEPKHSRTEYDSRSQKIIELEWEIRKLRREIEIRNQLIDSLIIEYKFAQRKRDAGEELNREIESLKTQLDIVRSRLKKAEEEVAKLQEEKASLEKLLTDIAMGRLVLIPEIKTYLSQMLQEEKTRVKGVYVPILDSLLNPEIVNELRSKKGFIITSDCKIPEIKRLLPVIEEKPVTTLGGFAVFPSSIIDKPAEMWRQIDEAEERERRERIYQLIEEYKKKRITS